MPYPVGTLLRCTAQLGYPGVGFGDVVRVTEQQGADHRIFNETRNEESAFSTWTLNPHLGWEVIEETVQPEERYILVYEVGTRLETLTNQPLRSFDGAVTAAGRRNIPNVPNVYLIPVRAVAKIDADGNIERYT